MLNTNTKSVPTNQMYHGRYGNYGMNKEEVDMRDKVIDSVLNTGCFNNVISVNGKTIGKKMVFWVEIPHNPSKDELDSVVDYFDSVSVMRNTHNNYVVKGEINL